MTGRIVLSNQPRREALRWATPRTVRISEDGEWVEWQYDARSSEAATAGGRGRMQGLLDAFLALGDADSAREIEREIERFARAWGVFHTEGDHPAVGARGHDRVSAWFKLVVFFAALERVGRSGKLEREDLAVIRAGLSGSKSRALFVAWKPAARGESESTRARELVRAVLEDFLATPNVRVRVLRDRHAPGGLRTEIGPTRLLGGLALALLRRIQRGDGLDSRVCLGPCGRLFRPERSTERYCKRCRHSPARVTQRKRRSRRARA